MRVRTVLADHGDLALVGLRAILAGVPRVDVVAEARDRNELYRIIADERPNVVVIDHTADGFGAEAIREGRKRWKRTRFVAITPDPSQTALISALRAGVTSYIKKDCGRQEIIDAVLNTADGGKFFCGKIVDAIQQASLSLERITDDPMSCEPVMLTERESEIIRLIADGLSYTRIAERTGITPNTVISHRRNIMSKLGVNSTAAVVMYAVKHGFASPNKFLFNS